MIQYQWKKKKNDILVYREHLAAIMRHEKEALVYYKAQGISDNEKIYGVEVLVVTDYGVYQKWVIFISSIRSATMCCKGLIKNVNALWVEKLKHIHFRGIWHKMLIFVHFQYFNLIFIISNGNLWLSKNVDVYTFWMVCFLQLGNYGWHFWIAI